MYAKANRLTRANARQDKNVYEAQRLQNSKNREVCWQQVAGYKDGMSLFYNALLLQLNAGLAPPA